jgi:hypothetical protein
MIKIFVLYAMASNSAASTPAETPSHAPTQSGMVTPTSNKIHTSKSRLESHISEAIIESPKQSQTVATIDSLGRVTIECEIREKQSTTSAEQEQ